MKNDIIQDYGKTVTPELYINALQGHQYIPQSDQIIRNLIERHYRRNDENWQNILDVGCGPGRLTFDVAKDNCTVLGLDISETFIKYAEEIRLQKTKINCMPSFQVGDFAKDTLANLHEGELFHTIFMQGVMHHIHGQDREKFFRRSFDLLRPRGIFIVGDEFIKDYESEDERIMNVAKFYLHIIDEARKGGFHELAEEEAKNLIDDCFSRTEFAGRATEPSFEKIYDCADKVNESFYESGYFAGGCNTRIQYLLAWIKNSIDGLIDVDTTNFNRGDFKVSTTKFIQEAAQYGFKLEEKYEVGPVQYLGGMGVLLFMKK